jgi:hypothetical protein
MIAKVVMNRYGGRYVNLCQLYRSLPVVAKTGQPWIMESRWDSPRLVDDPKPTSIANRLPERISFPALFT